MDNVIAFTPRQRPPEPAAPAPPAGLVLRAHLEDAVRTALDAADRIIAALDMVEGGAEPEAVEADSGLGPTEIKPAAQVVRLGDLGAFATAIAQACEEAPPEPESTDDTPPAEFEPDPVAEPESRAVFPLLPWGGTGNVVAATGCAILTLVAGAR